MAISDHKIKESDYTGRDVVSAPDRLTGTPRENKLVFDRLTKQIIIPALNALIDELTNSGASSVGTSVSGVAGTDVQTVLEGLKSLIDDRYTKEQADGLLGDKADKTEIAPMLADMTIDDNGVITVTRKNGTTKSWDTALEKIAVNFDFNPERQKLTLTLEDGTTKEVDLSAFVKPNEFIDSATIDFTAGADGTVTATIRAGSVTDEMLDSAIKEALIAYRDAAAASAAAAKASENNALTYKQAAETARTGAEKAQTEAGISEINAEVYAEGGTLAGHEGEIILQEVIPGAKGYMLLAQQYANNAATSASTADTRANAAAESERKAGDSESKAAASQTAAAASASAAKTSETNAADSAKRAEDAAARAGEIVGGDFATKNELNAHAGDTTKHVTATERTAWNAKLDAIQKGTAGGVATLGSDGKVPTAQLPEMDYDAAGSAAAVQSNLDAHTANQQNPHGVTAEQVGARPATWTPTAADVGAAPASHTADTTIHITATERTAWNAKLDSSQKGTAGGVATLGSDGKVPTAQLPNTGLMPELIVTFNAGSVITAVCGDQTVTATATDGTAVMALPGYGVWTVSATKDGVKSKEAVVTVDAVKQYAVTLQYPTIYGVVWDGTSTTAWTRTDDAALFTDPVPAVNNGSGSSPFDNLQPWAGMVRVTDEEAGELVAIPKFWYKFTKSGNTLKLQIADGQVDGFYVSPAHADRGDGKGERDIVYVGRYHCHTSNYKSQTGGKPKASITRSAARSGIHNLGTTIWQFDLAMRQTIQMLYLVEFADWNSQTKIGYGCGNDSATENMGATDGMLYHTGTMQTSRTTYGVGVQYRYIEGLWDNVYDWMDGCYYNSNGLNIIMNPNNFSDSANGTLVGKPSSGYPTVMSVADASGVQWMYPTTANDSNTTYIPDIWVFYTSYPCLKCGGEYRQNLSLGLFCVSCTMESKSYAFVGCRLQKLP